MISNEYNGYRLANAQSINSFGNISYQVVLENNSEYVTIKYNGQDIAIEHIKNVSLKSASSQQ